MCDYSLHNVQSRPAQVGDKLRTRNFGTGTTGFAASENAYMAVCLRPGTELAFEQDVGYGKSRMFGRRRQASHRTAIFRQLNPETTYAHRDALEFPDGEVVLLTLLDEGQLATVLQLPSEPAREAEMPAAAPQRHPAGVD